MFAEKVRGLWAIGFENSVLEESFSHKSTEIKVYMREVEYKIM